MAPGHSFLKKSLFDFLLFGFGETELHFKGDAAKSQLEIWGGRNAPAWKCKGCDVLVIGKKRSNVLD